MVLYKHHWEFLINKRTPMLACDISFSPLDIGLMVDEAEGEMESKSQYLEIAVTVE